MVSDFCQGQKKKTQAKAIVVPHAGYIYSGKIAGIAYGSTAIPDLVYLLCPNHSGMGKKISVWSQGSWDTPLGSVPVDEEAAAKFLERCAEDEGDCEAHLYEHANEVHLPFLKHLNPNVRIVPITLGPLHLDRCEKIGLALATEFSRHKADEALIIASTDMSHYISADLAREKDEYALKAIEALDSKSLYRSVVEHEISMCGFIPTTAVLAASSHLKASKGDLLAYGNSGDTTKDYRSVVAYASLRIS